MKAMLPPYASFLIVKRSILLCLTLAVLTGLSVSAKAADTAFSFEQLQERAKALAAKPYVAPESKVPDWMMALNYEQHREIRFARDHAIWKKEKLPFSLQFFHPGWLFKYPVKMNEIVGGRARPIEFDRDLFDYGKVKPGKIPSDLGYAGFRIHYPLNHADDELAVFLGASYFRAIAKGLHYGLSARGLAIDSGEPTPEEFPRFDEFWVMRPEAAAASITFFALMDSPSVSGAYRFSIKPGDETVMDVQGVLYFRRKPAVVGIAPLTSMFTHGENTGRSRNEFRPEVHDSDGLLMNTGRDEWIWRPLDNPTQTRVSTFSDKSPRGFGLMQRDRDFSHYDDLEAFYNQRPNVWVEPVGDWGAGAVRLLEITTPDETNDNIVAAWVPAELPAIGEPLKFQYRLFWYMNLGKRPPSGYVVSTRQGAVLHQPKNRRVIVDFGGLSMNPLPKHEPTVEITVGPGAKIVGEPGVQKVAPLGVWRAVFELETDGSGKSVELRCFLKDGKDILTETWSNLWTP